MTAINRQSIAANVLALALLVNGCAAADADYKKNRKAVLEAVQEVLVDWPSGGIATATGPQQELLAQAMVGLQLSGELMAITKVPSELLPCRDRIAATVDAVLAASASEWDSKISTELIPVLQLC